MTDCHEILTEKKEMR